MSLSRKLKNTWTLYYHLPDDTKWTIQSYPVIMGNIDTVEKVIALNKSIMDDTVRFNMLFVMKEKITPMWEDAQNRNGGCFSYKVYNKDVPNVWKKMICSLCGQTLTRNKKDMEYITGITISPKKSFCIIKIWLTSCEKQDTSIIIDIDNLPKIGCIFRKHVPEF